MGLNTTVFLIRHGVTSWHPERRVLGQRDIGLSEAGIAQARASADLLAGIPLADLISSPLVRAVQSAKIIGKPHGIDVARDPRLIDMDVGQWAGMTYQDVSSSPAYQQFVADPMSTTIPGGENFEEVRIRAVSALDQALADSPSGSTIAIVSHAGVIRILLAHYLGSPPANYHRIRVSPGSASVLSFADDRHLPRILAVNCLAGLSQVVSPVGDLGHDKPSPKDVKMDERMATQPGGDSHR